jgi:murein DD-endopeptidase MepM/ murein hydrolase activator NlpD
MTPLFSFAIDMEIKPGELLPGGILLIRAAPDTPSPSEAEFLGKSAGFYRDGSGDFITLLPVDIEAGSGEHPVTVRYGDGEQKIPVRVKAYTFETKKLTLPEEKVTLSKEDQKRAEGEYLLLEKLWKENTAKAWNGKFVSPTNTPVSEEYGVKRIMNEKKTSVHRGIDLKGKSGTPVRAINTGRVVLRKDLFYGGNTLVIDHGMRLMSVYMHLTGYNVPDSAEVRKGDVVGFVGMTGRATGPHLHMSVKLLGISVNPEALFGLDVSAPEYQ